MGRLAKISKPDEFLLGMTASRFQQLFRMSRMAAAQPAAHPHQLRHGGASADGLIGLGDASMLERGNWKSIRSISRYRQPSRYIRQLSILGPSQLVLAAQAPFLILAKVAALMRTV